MIKVPFPHMCLNAHNAPGENYRMWNTDTVPASKSVEEMVDQIVQIAKSAPGGSLRTLIFNSHGSPGRIRIGQHVTRADVDAGKFEPIYLGRLVKEIWIIACRVAAIKEAGTMSDGNYFCYRLAQETGAYVTAGSTFQWAYPSLPLVHWLPVGHIDDWEGTVYKWNPKGELCAG